MATILIVDDRSANRQFLSTLLGYVGHRTLEAANGAEALEQLGRESAALIITDILMPGMDGFELTQRLRDDPRFAQLPVIFHTATFSEPEALKLARSCGVRTVLPKPCEPQQVLDAVAKELGAPAPAAPPSAAGGGPDDSLMLYVDDLAAVKREFDQIAARGAELASDPQGLRRLSKKFAKSVGDLQRIGSRLTALIEVGLELMPERDPGRLVKLFFGAACEVIDAEYAAVAVFGEAGELLHSQARNVGVDLIRGAPAPLLEDLAQAQGARRLHMTGRAGVAGLPPGHPRVESFLGIPIATPSRRHGWLYFAARRGAAEFSEEDERLASILVAKLAVIYENAVLYDEVQRHAADLRIEVGERQRAESELRRFRLALDNSADIIIIIDRATMRHVDVNQTACRLLGYSREELLRMGPRDVLAVPQEELEAVYDRLIREPGGPSGMSSYYLCKDGSRLPFESTRHVLQQADGSWLIAAISRDIRERLAAEQALRQSEEGLRRAQAMAKLAHVVTGPDGGFETWSESLPQLVGVPPAALPRTTRAWLELVHPDDRDRFRRAAVEAGRTRSREKIGYRLRRADGAWIHMRQTMDPLDSSHERWFNTIQDVTEQKEAEERIARLNRVYAVLSGINTLIVRATDRDQLFREACRIAVELGGFRMAWLGLVDPAGERVTPLASDGDVRGFLDIAPLSDRGPSRPRGLAWQAVSEKRPVISNDVQADARTSMKVECRERGINSLALLPLVADDEGVGVLALYAAEVGFFDEDEMRLLTELAGDISFALVHLRNAERLSYLALYDELTGLPNRSLLGERLAQHLALAGQENRRVALVLVDIERFKTINDTFGRAAGDGLLREVAQRMRGRARDPNWIARVGADQFAVIVPDVTTDGELVQRTEARLREIFAPTFRVGDTDVRISSKLGIAVFPADGKDADALFHNAEAALKRAKATGERYLFYTEEMSARIGERLALEGRLRVALEQEQFVLHYQPKVSLADRSVLGVEALIRWQDPERGLVPPAQFIPLLEETGMILEVGAWAIRRAVLDHRHWLRQGIKAPRVAVNLSQIQLRHQDFVEVVTAAVADGANPTGLDLEITESLLMQDVKANVGKLQAVRKLGVDIAIDDFGTGYSSLSYLAKLPVQALKIDRSFVVAMLNDPAAMALVQTIISLAHALRLKVVAEGVETEEQAKMLRLLRCDEMQGYLVSKPRPIEDITPFLSKPA